MKILKSPRFSRRCLLIPAVALAITTSGNAALLSAFSASSTMENPNGPSLDAAINGKGLDSLSLTATHASTDFLSANSWISDPDRLTGDIFFDFNGLESINGFSFWNQNGGGPGEEGDSGIREVSFSYSNDGMTYVPIVGAPTEFKRETETFSSAQQFSFPTVNASFIKMTVVSNYNDTQPDEKFTGFAEIQFNTASVPDAGSSLALLGISILGLGGVRRWIAS